MGVKHTLTHLSLHPDSLLCAVSCEDLVLRVFDIGVVLPKEGHTSGVNPGSGLRLVRRFVGHQDRINCIQITSDSRQVTFYL